MDSNEIKNLRNSIDNILCRIQTLTYRIECLQNSETNKISMNINLGGVSIDNSLINSAPIREFIKHQIIEQFKSDIKKLENELKDCKYKYNNEIHFLKWQK